MIDQQTSTNWDDRRQTPRRAFSGPITLVIGELNHVFGTGVDISDGGLCVLLHRAMRLIPGEKVSVRVTREDRRRQATVVSRTPRGLHLAWIH